MLLVFTVNIFNAGVRPLLHAAGGLVHSSDNPFDFHNKIWLLLAMFLKYLKTGWNTKYVSWNIYRFAEIIKNIICHHL